MVVPRIKRNTKRQRIKDQIREWIASQGLRPGDRIQSQNELAEHFEVTAVTVHKAMTELAADGVLYRRTGSGTFVGPAPGSMGVRSVCLVLPGEHLEDPARNPVYWPYIQSLYRCFIGGIGDRRIFSTRAVAQGTPPAEAARDLAVHDVVFFHHIKEPRNLLLHLIREGKVPVVAFGLPQPEVACLTVDHDMIAGTRLAISHLHTLGHRRIAMVASRERWADYWREGYRQGLDDCSLRYDSALDFRVAESQEGVAEAARALTADGLRCDAIYCERDMTGIWMVESLRKLGVRVPEDVSVMGYDGLDLATRHPPYLTSVEIPYQRMIRASLDIVEGLHCKVTPAQHLSFAGEILPGHTVQRRPAARAKRRAHSA